MNNKPLLQIKEKLQSCLNEISVLLGEEEPGKIVAKTQKDMIMEGIIRLQGMEPDKWISSEVADYVYKKYHVRVNNSYINSVRQEFGHGIYDRIQRQVTEAMNEMRNQS